MLFRVLIGSVFMGIIAQIALAQGLSARDCVEIQATYGVQPIACTNLNSDTMSIKTPHGRARTPSIAEQQSHIFFQRGGTTLDHAALEKIEHLSRLLNADFLKNTCIMLVGHSDSIGPSHSNMRLSAARIAVVHNVLETHLTVTGRIRKLEARGEDDPLLTMQPNSAWQRRVEIRARDCSANS